MKAISVRRPAKILLACIGLAVCALAVRFGHWLPGNSDTASPVIQPSILSDTAASEKRPLRVAITADAACMPGVIENSGLVHNDASLYSTKYGITVDFVIVEDWETAFERLASGKIDVVATDTATFPLAYPKIRQANPVAFMQYCWYSGGDAIAAHTSIPSINDIRGKTLICAGNSRSHMLALYMLSLAGIRPGDVKWKFTITGEDAVRLFAKGRADMCAARSIPLRRALNTRKGARLLASTADASRLIAGIFVTRESWILTNRDRLVKFATGWFEGAYSARTNPQLAYDALAGIRGPSEPPQDIQEELAGVDLTDRADTLALFDIPGGQDIGFNRLFSISSGLWLDANAISSLEIPEIARNTDVILSVPTPTETPGKKPAAVVKSIPISTGWRILAGPIPLYFDKNSTSMEYASRARLKTLAETALLFPGTNVLLQGFESADENRWLALANTRAATVSTLLSGTYRIPRQRMYSPERGAFPPADQKNNSRVDACIAAPADR